jgi:CBS domain-containing protein
VGRLLLPKVKEVMSHPVVTAESEASVLAVVETMANSRVGSVVVVEGNAPTGMFTRHDLFERVLKVKKDPAQTRVGDVSSRYLATVGSEETLTAAVAKMQSYGYSRLVVTEKGRMVGILTNTDIRIRFSRGYMSRGLMLKKLAVDTAAYAIFWSSFSYIISVLIVGIEFDKYLASSAIGWVVTITFAGVYGRFLDIFRGRFNV